MIASHSSAATPNQHPKSDRARLGRELAGHDPTRRLAVDALCKPRRTPAVARLGLHEDLSSSPEPSRRLCQQPPSCRVRRPGTSSLHRRSLGAARGLAAPKGLQGRPRDVARAPPRGPTRWSPRAIPCPFRFRQLMAATTALAREEHSSSFLATHAAASHHRGPRPPPVQGLRGGAAAVRRQLKLGPAREGMRQPRAVPGLVPRSCTPRKALSHHPPQETGSRPASTGSVTDWTNLAIIEYVRDK